MKAKTIQKKRLVTKVFEGGLTKAFETLILILVIGVSPKALIAVPAVMAGSMVSKVIKIKVFD